MNIRRCRLILAAAQWTATSATTVESIVKYPIIGIYPPPGAGAYRNAFGNGKNIGDPGFIMTGPACADAMSPDNNCPLSADNGNPLRQQASE